MSGTDSSSSKVVRLVSARLVGTGAWGRLIHRPLMSVGSVLRGTAAVDMVPVCFVGPVLPMGPLEFDALVVGIELLVGIVPRRGPELGVPKVGPELGVPRGGLVGIVPCPYAHRGTAKAVAASTRLTATTVARSRRAAW
jgi:hypothetical protein